LDKKQSSSRNIHNRKETVAGESPDSEEEEDLEFVYLESDGDGADKSETAANAKSKHSASTAANAKQEANTSKTAHEKPMKKKVKYICVQVVCSFL